MPEYSFECEKCKGNFSQVWSIQAYEKEVKKLKCPFCKSTKVFRDYSVDRTVPNYIKGLHECETVGEYADKQTAKLSNDERQARIAGFKTKKDPNSGMKELPSGMSRSTSAGGLPSPLTKKQAKGKRK